MNITAMTKEQAEAKIKELLEYLVELTKLNIGMIQAGATFSYKGNENVTLICNADQDKWYIAGAYDNPYHMFSSSANDKSKTNMLNHLIHEGYKFVRHYTK